MSHLQVPPDVAEQIEELWRRFQPLAAQRVSTLERFAESRAAGRSDAELFNAATAAAHQLAGSLGSYGRPEAGTLAAAYAAMVREPDPDPGLLREVSRQLRALVGP